jgi:uncharacterized damage-inducible protein DinB
MHVDELTVLYEYGHWANKRLFQAMLPLTPEQFTQPVGGKYPSIRDILVHTVSAEWGWLSRCGGAQRGPALQPADYPSAASVREVYIRVEAYVSEFLSQLEDDDLPRIIEFTNPSGEKRSMPLGELMQHAAIHGVHHRGQIALVLQLLGYDPDNFDILLYHAERRGISAW